MGTDEGQPARTARRDAPEGAAAWGAQVQAAWAEGVAGWEGLAAMWGATADASAATMAVVPARCWWDEAPWHGQIADAEFRAIVAAYVERYGSYTPDLPVLEPDVLREWLRANRPAGAATESAAA